MKNKLTHSFLSSKAPAGMDQRLSWNLARFYELIGVNINVTSEHQLLSRNTLQWRRWNHDGFFYVYLRSPTKYLSICEGELIIKISSSKFKYGTFRFFPFN